MAKKLVIVESPSKSKTIEQYLGSEYIVKSSKGHIRDLAISGAGGLGVDVKNNFKPLYEIISDKKAIVKELVEATKAADAIFLATDPDREGEAISWHLLETIGVGKKPVKRVIFNEITKSAILAAFDDPCDLDMNLVSSQETRRILDRIIGFKLSKLMQSKIKSKSAGRVQSAALKLLVDREKEILAFVIEEYYEIAAAFPTFNADLAKYKNKTPKIATAEQADAILADLTPDFVVESVETKPKFNESKPAFITSTLQQEAANRLGFTSTKTMQIAQNLYEGISLGSESVGLISYMRTDSIRLSEQFVHQANEYIVSSFGKEYLGRAKQAAPKQNVQDAHEAIRPTDAFRTAESIKQYLTKDEFNLYQMIHAKAIASLMKAQVLEQTNVSFTNGPAVFKTTAYTPVFDGYVRLYGRFENYGDIQTGKIKLPKLVEGQSIKSDAITKKQCFTQPPKRYNEASLIKEMEEQGIGRPSTYAQTIATIKTRKYVTITDKKFIPSEQGIKTIDSLDEYFGEFISANYSRDMENILDGIAEGTAVQLDVITDFYKYFAPLVDQAMKLMTKLAPTPTGETCPVCGKPMVHRHGKFGDFEACGEYPTCKYVKKTEKQLARPKAIDTLVKCPECHKGNLVIRLASKGKSKGKEFLACNNFPKCKYIHPYQPTDAKCPTCQNILVEDEHKKRFCVDGAGCGYHEQA